MASAVGEVMEKFPKVKALLLWDDPKKTGGCFAAATILYFLIEKSGYTMLALFSNLMLFIVLASFVWGSAAKVLGRADMYKIQIPEIDEPTARKLGEHFQLTFNRVSGQANAVLSASDPMLTVKTAGALYVAAKIGGFFHFFSLIYLVIFLLFTVPKIYQMKKKEIDEMLDTAGKQCHAYYKVLESNVLSKIGAGKAKAQEPKAE